MTSAIGTYAQMTATLLVVACYGLALLDWARARRDEVRPSMGAARVWTTAAVALVLLLAGLRGAAFGWAEGWRFLTTEGQFELLRALGVAFLVTSGAVWAERCGVRPLRRRMRRWRRWPWGWLAAALAGMLGWTLMLAWLVPHTQTQSLMRWLRLEEMDPWLRAPTAMALLTLAPIVEECLFRHYLLYRIAGWLGRHRPDPSWTINAIVLTSILFALGHLGQIEPFWLKWLQVFVPGLVLGVTAWKHGLEAAIALHWGFNLGILGLGAALGGD
jgi:membrane protease YdiL (CAAX protease family)